MTKKRTRGDILREIAKLEDELDAMDNDYVRRWCGEAQLDSECTINRINTLRKELVGCHRNEPVNMKAYEYHIVSDVELDLEKIVREGIKGIIL